MTALASVACIENIFTSLLFFDDRTGCRSDLSLWLAFDARERAENLDAERAMGRGEVRWNGATEAQLSARCGKKKVRAIHTSEKRRGKLHEQRKEKCGSCR